MECDQYNDDIRSSNLEVYQFVNLNKDEDLNTTSFCNICDKINAYDLTNDFDRTCSFDFSVPTYYDIKYVSIKIICESNNLKNSGMCIFARTDDTWLPVVTTDYFSSVVKLCGITDYIYENDIYEFKVIDLEKYTNVILPAKLSIRFGNYFPDMTYFAINSCYSNRKRKKIKQLQFKNLHSFFFSQFVAENNETFKSEKITLNKTLINLPKKVYSFSYFLCKLSKFCENCNRRYYNRQNICQWNTNNRNTFRKIYFCK